MASSSSSSSLPSWPTRGERKRPAPPPPVSDPPAAAAATARQQRRRAPVVAAAGGDEEKDEDEDDLGLAPEVTDVVAALSLLSQRLYQPASASATASGADAAGSRGKKKRQPTGPPPPLSAAPLLPVVLQHQLYTVLDDATAVDVELEALRRQQFVRCLKLLTQRQADVAVCLASTYLGRLQAAVDQCEALAAVVGNDEPSSGAAALAAANAGSQEQEEEGKEEQQRARRRQEAEARVYALRFLMEAAGRFTSLSVTRQELEAVMAEYSAAHAPLTSAAAATHHPRSKASPSPSPSSMVDRALRPLLKLGFLARRVDSRTEEAYWFSAPELGRITASLPAGRTAILAALRRSRYKELSARNVQGLDLKGSALSPEFHVADLVGAKEVLAIDTASGRFLRLPPGAAEGAAGRGGARRSGR